MAKTLKEYADENEELRSKLLKFEAQAKKNEEDDKEVNERIRISGGLLSRDQAVLVVQQQREWEANPQHPDNLAKAKKAEAEPKAKADKA